MKRPIEIKLSSEINPVDTLKEGFAGAAKTIDAVVYKFNQPQIFKALKKALDRGVKVRLVVDSWLIDYEKKGFTWKLVKKKRGAKVKMWTSDKLHVKFVIIDGQDALFGSYNWTKSAKKKNTEMLLRTDNKKIVKPFTKMFKRLWKDAEKVPTHAGGVVFRVAGDEVEFLVVQALDNPTQWVFPKGHIEAGEPAAETARREVREEAGVSAEILGEVGSYEFELAKETVRTRYFLMRYTEKKGPGEARGRRWCGYAEARKLLTFADTRELLTEAEKLRRRLGAS